MAVFFFVCFVLFFVFGQMIRCEVEQTSEDFIGPGNKLADNLTPLTTGKEMKPLVQIYALPTGFFSEKNKIWCFVSLDVWMSLNTRVFIILFFTFTYFFCCCNICFVALQETEMEKLQKTTRVRIITVVRIMKPMEVFPVWFNLKLFTPIAC